MPVLQGSVSVAANTLNTNVLSGSRFERLPLSMAADISLFLAGSAAGLEADFFVGQESHVDRATVSAANRVPQREDAIAVGIPANGGDLLQLPCRNTTGGALTLYYRVEINPVR